MARRNRHATRPHYRFKPWNVGRWVLWGLFASVLAVAPLMRPPLASGA